MNSRTLVGKTEGQPVFWEITWEGPEVEIAFGELGDDGELLVKSFDSERDAARFVATEIERKKAQGFAEEADEPQAGPVKAGANDAPTTPGDALDCVKRALSAAIENRLDDALRLYDEAIAIAPTLAEAWAGKGQVLRERGQIAPAINAYLSAVELDCEVGSWWQAVAELNLDLGQTDEALRMVSIALDLDDEDVDSLITRCVCLASLGELEDAVDMAEEILEIYPSLKGELEDHERLGLLHGHPRFRELVSR